MIERTGAVVQYCGHDGTFVADVYKIGGAMVVRSNGPVKLDELQRPARGVSYHMLDYPRPGFWRPDLGVFVVPADQLVPVEPGT